MSEDTKLLEKQDQEISTTSQEQQSTIITYKTKLGTWRKKYVQANKEYYLAFLKQNILGLHSGKIGIYLTGKVNFNGQNLYFPFINIEGDRGFPRDAQIESAIKYTLQTYIILQNLGASEYFNIIATGTKGFKVVSNILLDIGHYRAFIAFLKREMPHIRDFKSTELVESKAHQLFTYNGHPNQQREENIITGHSVVMPNHIIKNEGISYEYYQEKTQGPPDPEEFIRCTESFLNFRPMDLDSLGEFGKRLRKYYQPPREASISNTFNIIKKNWKSIPLQASLELTKQRLEAQNIPCKIENRWGQDSISFIDLPCPICKSTSAEAWASPPLYRLICKNIECPASYLLKGIPLRKWAGFSPITSSLEDNPRSNSLLKAPTEFVSKEEARDKIVKALSSEHDSLVLVTPGVGKTHATLQYLAENMMDKLVLYSCYNKALRDEAFEKMKTFSDRHDDIYKLESMKDLCQRQDEINNLIDKGFSPLKMLCVRCQFTDCVYKNQREGINKGIYFITHQMLPYLKKRIPTPNLIILDENLLQGFFLKEVCNEEQMKTLEAVLSPDKYMLIDQILQIGKELGCEAKRNREPYPVILNGEKLTFYEDSLIYLLSIRLETTEGEIRKQISRIAQDIYSEKLKSPEELYRKGIDFKAGKWLLAFLNPGLLSILKMPPWQYPYLRIDNTGNVEYSYRYITPLPFPKTPIKILDATGNLEVSESLTKRRIEVVKADVEWPARKIHIKRQTSRKAIKPVTRDKELKQILTTAIEKMSSQKILIITYKFLKQKVIAICQEIDPNRIYEKTFEGHHFQGPRGINRYADCDGAIVLGLPYANLKKSHLCAHVLFPGDEAMRNLWSDLFMNWELVQGFHRIRPVNKENSKIAELIVISNDWPPMLPEPDKIIDQTHNKDWEDLVIRKLDPYVKEFGFLNPDIGYIADIYGNRKKNVFDKFRNKINGLLEAYDVHRDNVLVRRIKNLLSPSPENPISLSTNQWKQILTFFKLKYPHYEFFKIKLPYTQGNPVNGVGDKESVLNFYNQISQLEVFGNVNLESYETIEKEINPISPIPDGFAVVYIPQHKIFQKIVYVGTGNDINLITIEDGNDFSQFKDKFSELIQNKKVITNMGKGLARLSLFSGLNPFEINDVILNERIIKNGNELPRGIVPKYLFKTYELTQDVDLNMLFPQLHQVWEKQQKIIDQLHLRNIIDLEKKVLWLTVKIGITGIGIDIDQMVKYKKETNALNTILKAVKNDSRIHDRINQLGTYNGRFKFSVLDSVKNEHIRSFFRAKPGYKFVIGKYFHHDLRIIMGLSDDQRNIELLSQDRDIYIELLMRLTGKSEEECRPYRRIGEQIFSGLCYGKFPKALYLVYKRYRDNIGISMPFDKFQKVVIESYLNILVWKDRVFKNIKETGYMTTIFGRRLNISKNTFNRRVFNMPPSFHSYLVKGTGVDGLKMALVDLDEKLENINARIVHIYHQSNLAYTIHDEIIVEAKEDVAENVAEIMGQCMEKPFRELLPKVSFKVELTIRDTWGIVE